MAIVAAEAAQAPLYRGLLVAVPHLVADAAEAKRIWNAFLPKFGFTEEVALAVSTFLVDTMGLETLDDFRTKFHAQTDFLNEVVVKCTLPPEQPGGSVHLTTTSLRKSVWA